LAGCDGPARVRLREPVPHRPLDDLIGQSGVVTPTNLHLDEPRSRRFATNYQQDGCAFAIDVFVGLLAGLVLAEIALDREVELRALRLPVFAHSEVTD
jgi:hypothetical protein